MKKFETCTEYWLDPNSLEFRGLFDEMYRDVDDPWGCEKGNTSLNNRIFSEIISETAPYNKIIDIGSGLGGYCSQLKARFPDSCVFGCDVAHEAVEKARRKYPEIAFYQFDILRNDIQILKTAVGGGGANLVTLCEVVWYLLEDLKGVFSKISDILNPGGILAVHQYFPNQQKFGVDVINGLRGFDKFVEQMTIFVQEARVVSHCSDGLVLLATYSSGDK